MTYAGVGSYMSLTHWLCFGRMCPVPPLVPQNQPNHQIKRCCGRVYWVVLKPGMGSAARG